MKLARTLRRKPVGPPSRPPLGQHLTDEEKLAEIFRHCAWPAQYYSNTRWLVQVLGPSRVVEIGVAYGFHADAILKASDCTYTGVDPYLAGYDEADPFAQDVAAFMATTPQLAMDQLHQIVLAVMSRRYGKRFALARATSHEAAASFEDGSVDLVFIDGDHRREAIMRDLEDWWPKIRSGGVLAGDDFDVWKDVRDAVTEFSDTIGVDPVTLRSTRAQVSTFAFHKL